MCIFLSGAEKLRYKQPKAELKNNYIPGMDGYLQDLPGVMKLINNFFLLDQNPCPHIMLIVG